MAIDDADKRKSVSGIPMNPDGTISAQDRQHIAGFYRGIAAAAPPVAVKKGTKGLLLGVFNGNT